MYWHVASASPNVSCRQRRAMYLMMEIYVNENFALTWNLFYDEYISIIPMNIIYIWQCFKIADIMWMICKRENPYKNSFHGYLMIHLFIEVLDGDGNDYPRLILYFILNFPFNQLRDTFPPQVGQLLCYLWYIVLRLVGSRTSPLWTLYSFLFLTMLNCQDIG